MKTILLFLALASAALGQMSTTTPKNLFITTTTGDTHLFRQATPEEQMRAEANRLKAILAHADPEPPLTTMWGEDYLKAHPMFAGEVAMKTFHFFMLNGGRGGPSYELGLRSDGVIVWREVK